MGRGSTSRHTPTSTYTPGVDYYATSERIRYEDLSLSVREAADVALGSPVVRAAVPVTSGFTSAYAGSVLLRDGRHAFLKPLDQSSRSPSGLLAGRRRCWRR